MTITVIHTISDINTNGSKLLDDLFKEGFIPTHFLYPGALEPGDLESHCGDEPEAYLCALLLAKPGSGEDLRHVQVWVKPGEIDIDISRVLEGDFDLSENWIPLQVKSAEVQPATYHTDADYPYIRLTIHLDFGPGAGEYHIIVCDRAVASGWAQVEQKTF